MHRMMTRSRTSVLRPNPHYANVATSTSVSPIPFSMRAVLRDPNWKAAMQEEIDALMANRTWELVARPPKRNIITGKMGVPGQDTHRWHLGAVQGKMGGPWLHPMTGHQLRRDI
jgi:hypothetical protein